MVEADAAELMVSQSELAELKGVSPQAISKRMKRLETEGLLHPQRRGGRRVVSLAEWDRVTNETTDFARVVGRETAGLLAAATGGDADGSSAKADPTYTEQLTRKAKYDADLKAHELARLRGEVLAIEDVRRAMSLLAEEIARDLDQLPSFAEDVHAAAAKGIDGTRAALRSLAFDLRERLDRNLAQVEYAADQRPAEAA